MTNKSDSWAGCTCDIFSILRKRTVNVKPTHCKMAETPQYRSYQLAYSALTDLNVSRTHNIVLPNGTLSSLCLSVYMRLFL